MTPVVKNPPSNAGDTRDVGSSERSPGVGNGKLFLPGIVQGQRMLAGYLPWDCKELDMTEHACVTQPLWNRVGSSL